MDPACWREGRKWTDSDQARVWTEGQIRERSNVQSGGQGQRYRKGRYSGGRGKGAKGGFPKVKYFKLEICVRMRIPNRHNLCDTVLQENCLLNL